MADPRAAQLAGPLVVVDQQGDLQVDQRVAVHPAAVATVLELVEYGRMYWE